MKIRFSSHSENKFTILSRHGVNLTKTDIRKVIKTPEDIDINSSTPKVIVSKSINEKLVLRVMYKRDDDIITVITFYPAKVGRYYKP